MANNTFAEQDISFAAMQKELQFVKYQLEQASRTLAQKDQLIGGLEQDLEHMIDQLVKINNREESAVAAI